MISRNFPELSIWLWDYLWFCSFPLNSLGLVLVVRHPVCIFFRIPFTFMMGFFCGFFKAFIYSSVSMKIRLFYCYFREWQWRAKSETLVTGRKVSSNVKGNTIGCFVSSSFSLWISSQLWILWILLFWLLSERTEKGLWVGDQEISSIPSTESCICEKLCGTIWFQSKSNDVDGLTFLLLDIEARDVNNVMTIPV